MISKNDLIKISDYLWEIPKKFRSDSLDRPGIKMRVPARIYASEKMLNEIFKDKSLEQLVNLATLQGIVNYSIVMPDAHEGYGSPIGGVFATDIEKDGIISPGAVGYDINCGVRLLKSNLSAGEIKENLDSLAEEIQRAVPSGLGRGHKEKLSIKELDEILEGGAQKIVSDGFGEKEDIENCEANGRLNWADASMVSETAKNRGRDQVGTLGSGNHFLEIQKVEKIFDEIAAKKFGLFENQIAVMIHTGSRGLGHQIATDYIRLMVQTMPKYGIRIAQPSPLARDIRKRPSEYILPDRELACAPFKSPEGQRYFKAMACGANFAWANRQMITYYVRQMWNAIINLRPTPLSSGQATNDQQLKVLYDVAHNIAKLELYKPTTNNQQHTTELLVHRKGATRAFPPNHSEIPEKYREVGQPVLIPGSMGTASYVLCGQDEGKESFYSACHGAGRTMSRHQALRMQTGKEVVKNLESKGIIVKSYSMRGIAEEAPQAYKDIDEVVEIVDKAKLAKKVARLVPLAVIKGE